MLIIQYWLASPLLATLVLSGVAIGQPPERKAGPARTFNGPNRLSTDDVVERITAFDKNKDGKVTKDELPERMLDLITRGDTDKDGALDKEEIKKLATNSGEFGGRGGFGGGGFGIGGRTERGVVGPGPGGPGPLFGDAAGVVEDLKLSSKKKDQAMAAVKAHQENVRKLMDQSRVEFLKKMKEILSEEELKDFQAALDRPRGAVSFNVGPPDAPRPGELERKLEQLQKELDDLKRRLRR